MDDIKEKELQREAADDKLIEAAFKEMLDIYLASPHRKKVDIITKAFNFAKQAHKGVRRLSGEPYIMHPIAVARIAVEEMGLGSTSICAALLHDVVEDTDYTVEDIENIFGEKVAMIVDGLTKISGGIFDDHKSAQAENFKKLLLGDGVHDVRFARESAHAFVRLLGEVERLCDDVHLLAVWRCQINVKHSFEGCLYQLVVSGFALSFFLFNVVHDQSLLLIGVMISVRYGSFAATNVRAVTLREASCLRVCCCR